MQKRRNVKIMQMSMEAARRGDWLRRSLVFLLVSSLCLLQTGATLLAEEERENSPPSPPKLELREVSLERSSSATEEPSFAPGELMVKIKEGANLSDLDGLNHQFGVTATEQVFPKRPSAQERLGDLKKKRAGLDSPNHQDWYWWSDKEAAEVKDYAKRIEQEKADLDQIIRGVEELVQRLERRQRRVQPGTERPNLEGIYRLHLPPDADIPAIAAVYRANPSVEYAHPTAIVHASLVPNDTYYSSEILNPGFKDSYHLTQPYGNFEKAWDLNKGEGILVAVVDSGVKYDHEDLAGNVRSNPGEIAGNGVDDDHNGYVDDVRGFDFHVSRDNNGDKDYDDPGDVRDADPMDETGHGTKIAGVVAAVGNNGKGVIGAAFKAKIMPVRMLGNPPSFTRPEAIRYAVDNGADVINNSWVDNMA